MHIQWFHFQYVWEIKRVWGLDLGGIGETIIDGHFHTLTIPCAQCTSTDHHLHLRSSPTSHAHPPNNFCFVCLRHTSQCEPNHLCSPLQIVHGFEHTFFFRRAGNKSAPNLLFILGCKQQLVELYAHTRTRSHARCAQTGAEPALKQTRTKAFCLANQLGKVKCILCTVYECRLLFAVPGNGLLRLLVLRVNWEIGRFSRARWLCPILDSDRCAQPTPVPAIPFQPRAFLNNFCTAERDGRNRLI